MFTPTPTEFIRPIIYNPQIVDRYGYTPLSSDVYMLHLVFIGFFMLLVGAMLVRYWLRKARLNV